jgi:FtsZ-binding cell division protein ZapB
MNNQKNEKKKVDQLEFESSMEDIAELEEIIENMKESINKIESTILDRIAEEGKEANNPNNTVEIRERSKAWQEALRYVFGMFDNQNLNN